MIKQYLIVLGFFVGAVLLMALSLHFSKYKKRKSGCCGGEHCSSDGKHEENHSCYNEKLKFVDNQK